MYNTKDKNSMLEYKKITLHSKEELEQVKKLLIEDRGYSFNKSLSKEALDNVSFSITIYLGSELTKTIYLEEQINLEDRDKFDSILSLELQ